MKEVKEMPKDQQFVAMWEYDGKIWSDTVCWIEEKEYFLVWSDVDECYGERFDLSEDAESTVKYFVLESE